MKVAFVTSGYPPVSPGGAGISSQLIVDGIRAAGASVDVFAIVGEQRDCVAVDDCEWHLPAGEQYPVPKAIGENVSSYVHLPDLNAYDVVHVYNVRHLPACILRSSVPVVASFNNHMWACIDPREHLREGLPRRTVRHDFRYAGTKGYSGLGRLVRTAVETVGRFVATRADAYTVQTDGMLDVLDQCGYDRERITVVPNLVDPAFDVEPDNGRTVMYVGRLHRSKGPEMPIKAFSRLPDDLREEWSLVLYGAGPLRDDLERLTRERGLDSVEITHCPYSQLPDAYADAGVFVHPSTYTEPFSRCWLEAMASGTPIVCSRNPSSTAILDGIGTLYDPFSVESLTGALRTVLTDPSRRAEMAEAGARSIDRYRSENVCERYLDVYRSVL